MLCVFMVDDDEKRITTSIKIDPKLWKETKIQAIQDEITVSELLEGAIRDYIKRKKGGGLEK
jgi:hypothetical protein